MKLKIPATTDLQVGNKIHGYIYGDTRGKFADGEYVITSTVQEVSADGLEVKTRNSTYEIERVSQEELIALAVSQ
jgi:hypothetical protein